METQRSAYLSALDDFDRLHRRAAMERLWGGMRGQRLDELLSYEDVSRRLRVTGRASSGLHDIALDAIVGSVGRYQDFTRKFIPKRSTGRERWARVRASAEEMAGWPPIQVYQIGEAYFVLDGNHRVSVARELGAKTIQADVTEIRTRVPLTPDDTPDDIIAKAEYAEFLEETRLDDLVPDANLRLTIAHGYPQLREHIVVHRHFMGLEHQREIPFEEAVAHWYEVVYLPIVEMIRASGLLRRLPDRTEAEVAKEVKQRARWTDLIVVNVAHPPGGGVLNKLRPGFRSLVRQTAWPMLVTPSHTSSLTRPLLAYDGSPNSVQALYLLTYLAGRWQLPVTVLTVIESLQVSQDVQRLPKDYFHAHGVDRNQVTFVEEQGPVGPAILRSLEIHECDCIVMGSYSRTGIGDIVADSTLDVVLRSSWWPILVCR